MAIGNASLLIPFSLGADLDGLDLRRRLSDGELRFVEHHVGQEVEISEWRAQDGPYGGTLLLIRPVESGDLGCAVITGEGRVELAQALVNLIPYVPADLLHLAVRTHPAPDVRRVALRVLRMLHVGGDGALVWEPTLAATVAGARADEDFEVRRLALACELDGNPSAGRRHLVEAIKAATDRANLAEQASLEGLRDSYKDALLQIGAGKIPDEPGRALRFAFPIYPLLGMDELVAAYSPFCTVERRDRIPSGPGDCEGERERVDLKLRDGETRLTIVLDAASTPMSGAASASERNGRTSRIGGVFFAGPEAAELALGAAAALSYLPLELASVCARQSRFADFRARGVYALGMAESNQGAAGGAIDSSTSAVLEAALHDSSPTVAAAARTVGAWLTP